MMANLKDGRALSLCDFVFYIGFALLACHELDAVGQAEWKLLPILGRFSDEVAYATFVAGHIPIFAALMWLSGHRSPVVKWRSQMGIDAFLMGHAGLHWLLSDHPLYTFDASLSKFLIFGGGLVGLLHLAILLFRSHGNASKESIGSP